MSSFIRPILDRGEAPLCLNTNKKHTNLAYQKQSLPITRLKNHILYAIEKYPTVIIVGETGSGKTTQITQYLHEAQWTSKGHSVICTQSRRISAISVSSRVAEEMGVKLGEEVGYSIRFDAKCSKHTVIKYCTDGALVRETMSDPLLTSYSVVIVDEAHERSLYSDILLGLLKKIRKKRKDLRIVIMSATVDSVTFKNFFETNVTPQDEKLDTAKIISIQGRMHAVDILYLETPCRNYIASAVNTVLEIHKSEGGDGGDVLVFLPGSEDIDRAIEQIESVGVPFFDFFVVLFINY